MDERGYERRTLALRLPTLAFDVSRLPLEPRWNQERHGKTKGTWFRRKGCLFDTFMTKKTAHTLYHNIFIMSREQTWERVPAMMRERGGRDEKRTTNRRGNGYSPGRYEQVTVGQDRFGTLFFSPTLSVTTTINGINRRRGRRILNQDSPVLLTSRRLQQKL